MYSKYNVYLNNYPNENFTTIFNIMTQELVCYADKNLFPEPNKIIVDGLMKKGIYCKNEFTEVSKAIRRYEDTVHSNEELVIVILLTGICNCKCVYCYESDLELDFNQISEPEKIIKFISNKMKENQVKNLRIVFYGGEPLLNKGMITKLSTKLAEIYGEDYKFSIVTNGTLLNVEDIDIWTKLGLSRIKVTLDGDSTCHNSRRPFRNGEGTYDVIMQNLEKINNHVKVVINIIIDEQLSGISEMLKDIKSRGIKAAFSLSFKEPISMSIEERKDYLIKCSKILKIAEVDFQTNIKAKHGIICPMKRKNYYVIDGKGQLFGCESNLSKAIGNIEIPIDKVEYKLSNRCKECKYLPICYGECVYNHYCQREYFEQLLPELLKVYIQID